MALLSVSDALGRVLDGLTPLEAEDVSLDDAQGRVLAADLAALVTQPPFDASAMDGYAVRGEDVSALPATLRMIGEAAAGQGFGGAVGGGEAVRIFTGAPVPKGANTIVIQEDVEADGANIVVKAAELFRHIRPRGQDFKDGEILLRAGTQLEPRHLMLAAAMNHASLPVRRSPKVAILATGDEVRPPGTKLAPDQIVSSVPAGLAAFVRAAGGEALSLGIAKDDPDSIATLARAGSAADILVTIGGASVGERDLVASALKPEGLVVDFWKVAMRPGKPLLSGRMGSTRFLGLPGNPVSAFVCAHVFLKPILRRLLGAGDAAEEFAGGMLGADLEANGPRQHYIRATSTFADQGRIVTALPSQDSSLVAALALADCLIVRAPDAPAGRAGDPVKIIVL
jgi:molybdopterin molybdotransferase